MLQQEVDLVYCYAPECKRPNKIISSALQQSQEHNGHITKTISQLRSELIEKDNDVNRLKIPITNDKDHLMSYIDQQMEQLTKVFSQIMLDLGTQLKSFVNDNLVSLKHIQLLFKAVMENNRDHIKLYQRQLEFLKRDSEYFEGQDQIFGDVKLQLQKTCEAIQNKVFELNKFMLQKLELKIVQQDQDSQGFRWSSVNKHQNIKIDGNSVQSVQNWSIFQTVLLEPSMNFQWIRKVQLKLNPPSTQKQSYNMIQICDLTVVKKINPFMEDVTDESKGAYLHIKDGRIYGAHAYGQGKTKSFTFLQGDIIELQWNGPLKTFTTVKISTGEKFEFKVNFKADADIHFGVVLFEKESFQLV